MSQFMTEQQVRATGERAMAKFAAFVEGLPDGEREVLAAMLRHRQAADEHGDDATGHIGPTTAVWYFPSHSASGGLGAVNSIDWNAVYEGFGLKQK
jgi:hypothetical protein